MQPDECREFQLGKEWAINGGPSSGNPYSNSGEYWQWRLRLKGFLAGRTPDPYCPYCRGAGVIVTPPPTRPEDYGGFEVPCYQCNRPSCKAVTDKTSQR